MNIIKHLTLILVLILPLSIALPAKAYTCRNYQEHQICILSIQRSAKNYWEYRVVMSVDGVKTPVEVYNCRSQVKVQQDGTLVPFGSNDPGKLICGFFNKS